MTSETVMHSREAILVTKCYTFPHALLGSDQVSEAFANLGEAGERRNVFDGEVEQDLDEEFFRDSGNGTRWCGGEIGWWSFALDGEG